MDGFDWGQCDDYEYIEELIVEYVTKVRFFYENVTFK